MHAHPYPNWDTLRGHCPELTTFSSRGFATCLRLFLTRQIRLAAVALEAAVYARWLDDVPIIVEDRPSPADLHGVDDPDEGDPPKPYQKKDPLPVTVDWIARIAQAVVVGVDLVAVRDEGTVDQIARLPCLRSARRQATIPAGP